MSIGAGNVGAVAIQHIGVSVPDLAKAREFYIDLLSPSPPGGLPQPTAGRIDIPNRHLEYALTWFEEGGIKSEWLDRRLRVNVTANRGTYSLFGRPRTSSSQPYS